MKYNPAEAYALAIGHLADRLRGGSRSRRPGRATSASCHAPSGSNCSNTWPGSGFDVGEPDGQLGAPDPRGIREFQARHGHVPDGFASGDGARPATGA